MNTKTKTPGQIAFEAYVNDSINAAWENLPHVTRPRWEAAALAVLASQWRPVTEPPEDASSFVILRGGIGTRVHRFSNKAEERTHWAEIPPFMEPIDPYAELRQAHAAGKVIQCLDVFGDWAEIDRPVWSSTPSEYRIKPWALTNHIPGFRALEPGEEWHRDDFTEEMLPGGWRPLLTTESVSDGDSISVQGKEWTRHIGEQWGKCAQQEPYYFQRTRRPLPPTKRELERKEFEEWAFNAGYGCSSQQIRDTLFIGWQAARKQQEGK